MSFTFSFKQTAHCQIKVDGGHHFDLHQNKLAFAISPLTLLEFESVIIYDRYDETCDGSVIMCKYILADETYLTCESYPVFVLYNSFNPFVVVP